MCRETATKCLLRVKTGSRVAKKDFCATPKSGHPAYITACPKGANNGLMRRRPASLFDHLVGAREKRRRHVEADRLGGLYIDHKFEFDWELDR
jgi:hypothetical protein